MANPEHVELEAAKFLHKLIQDSKDEPTKLAAKLYVVSETFFYGMFCCFSLLHFPSYNAYMYHYFVCYLWVKQILQHMRASGKENSMPFQVISR